MLLFVLIGEWLMPGCFASFLHVALAYRHYTYGHSLLDVWFTSTFGPIASFILLLIVLALSWQDRSQAADSPRFVWLVSLLLAATVVVIPTLAPHAQLLLLPGFLSLLHNHSSLMKSNPTVRLVLAAAWMLLAWPWISAFGLLAATLSYPTAKLRTVWEVPLYTSPLLPLVVLLAVGCLLRRRTQALQ